jgi:predicted RNA-binding protein with PUA-like domain
LFYHSVAKPLAIMGIAKVVKEAYPDAFAFDPKSDYYDPKSSPENPRWVMVDLQFESAFLPPITLDELKQRSGLEEMMLLRKGCRLSVQPVTAHEWEIVCNIRG